jgi:hypothetical protein
MAHETGRTEAELIREGIRLAVAERKRPKPSIGIFDSGDPSLSERVDELLEGFGRDDPVNSDAQDNALPS